LINVFVTWFRHKKRNPFLRFDKTLSAGKRGTWEDQKVPFPFPRKKSGISEIEEGKKDEEGGRSIP
jgi:hypothetical protein